MHKCGKSKYNQLPWRLINQNKLTLKNIALLELFSFLMIYRKIISWWCFVGSQSTLLFYWWLHLLYYFYVTGLKRFELSNAPINFKLKALSIELLHFCNISEKINNKRCIDSQSCLDKKLLSRAINLNYALRKNRMERCFSYT